MAYNNGRFDYAVWDPISGRNSLSNRVDRMTIHTAATTSDDIYGPQRGPGDTYAHFYNPSSKRIRQHQEIHHKAYADGHANGYVVAVEHEDAGPSHGVPLTDKQIDDDARLFAHLVQHFGLPNRIATVDNTKGLAWHRLGIQGNFPAYDPHNRRTWTGRQTGQNWSDVYGKECPWDVRIDQIPDIYNRAQHYIDGTTPDDDDTSTDEGDDEMPKWKNTSYGKDYTVPADGDWHVLTIGEGDDGGVLYSFLTGPKRCSGVLNVSVQGLALDKEIDLRPVVVQTKKGVDTKVITQFPETEFFTGGNSATAQLTIPFTQDISKGSDGASHKLRFQIRPYGGGHVTLTNVRVRAIYWEND